MSCSIGQPLRQGEAARQRQRGVDLVGRDGLDGLVVLVGVRDGLVEGGDGCDVDVVLALGAGQDAGDLAEALVAAGLEDGRGHGDRPDARAVDVLDVLGVRAAGVGDAELAVELLGDAVREVDGEREQRAAAHVHLLARQLLASDVDREGVRELDAEGEAALGSELDQALEHRHGVGPLQVLAEVLVVEGDVVEAEGVEAGARVVIAEQGRVALDVGVQALLGDEVGGDALDLVGRAAMQRGLGHGAGDARAHGLDEGLVDVGEAVEVLLGPSEALAPDLGLGGVLHALDVGVDLGALDALEVVADGHVEHEAVGVAEAELAGEELARPPSLDVLVHGLRDRELRGPLAVVALVLGHDAGLRDALRDVGGDDVLGELAVGAGGGAERGLDLLGEDRVGTALVLHDLADAEDAVLLGVLGEDPVHKLRERDRPHDVAHTSSSPCPSETARKGGFSAASPRRGGCGPAEAAKPAGRSPSSRRQR